MGALSRATRPTGVRVPRVQATRDRLGKCCKKKTPSPTSMMATCKKYPKSHTDARKLQKNPPSPASMLLNVQRCLAVTVTATFWVRAGFHSRLSPSLASVPWDGSVVAWLLRGCCLLPYKDAGWRENSPWLSGGAVPTRSVPAELRAATATAGPPTEGSLGRGAPLKSWRLPTETGQM